MESGPSSNKVEVAQDYTGRPERPKITIKQLQSETTVRLGDAFLRPLAVQLQSTLATDQNGNIKPRAIRSLKAVLTRIPDCLLSGRRSEICSFLDRYCAE